MQKSRAARVLFIAFAATGLVAVGSAAAQSGQDEPFAVTSRGRPGPRGERTAVIVRDSAPLAPPVAPAVVDSAPPTPARTAPAAAPRRVAAARPAGVTRTHRVEWGDTWYGIARQYAVTAAELAAANPDVDPSRLRSGEVLRIPGVAGASGKRTHRVEAGESLWGIARKYGVSAASIRRANKLDGDRVRTGDTLVIPGGD